MCLQPVLSRYTEKSRKALFLADGKSARLDEN